jgi:hypothetical protein
VRDAISARIKELGMPADEIVTRLTQQARANAAEFFSSMRRTGFPAALAAAVQEAEGEGRTGRHG